MGYKNENKEMGGACSAFGVAGVVYRWGNVRERWEDNFKMDFQEVRCEVMDWIDLAEDRAR